VIRPDCLRTWGLVACSAITKTPIWSSLMKCVTLLFTIVALCLSAGLAQQAPNSNTAAVPHFVRFAGVIKNLEGQPRTGTVGVTFALYRDQEGGPPLWLETQNVAADNNGHYSVSLGATKTEGLPVEMFTSGEARWLGVQPDGQAEQPRVLLLSVPYALKAADAETVGGLPPSAFMLAPPPSSELNSTPTASPATPGSTNNSVPSATSVTGSGTLNFLPLWTGTTTIGNSVVFQSGTGSTAKLGINTTTPGATLDVKGAANVQGLLTSPATGAASSAGGKSSQPHDFVASSFSSSTKAAVNQTFQWKAESATNNTATPSGTLNLLFGSGTAAPVETGLKLNSKGLFTFAAGQTFPGTGTITGVTTATGSGLSGGGTAGSLTLSLLKTCSANQVLQWSGTAWACAAIGGGGTVTSVALAAPASDFTVSGSPIKGAGTLTLGWTVTPSSANTANAIVKRDSLGNFATNSVTASSVVTSGLTATTVSAGSVSASGSISGTAGSFSGGLGASTQTDADFATGILGQQLGVFRETIGVEGSSNSLLGIGVYGTAYTQSTEGTSVVGAGSFGVWGDTGRGSGFGVVATADDGYGVSAFNASQSFPAGFFKNDESASNTSPILDAQSSSFGGECVIDVLGNLTCTGVKSAAVPVDNGTRKVALYAVEAPENWFEDFGSGQLSNGAAVIALEPTFRQTVNVGVEYHVFLSPRGECEGLYVANTSATGFEVRELHHGSSTVAFDYRIVARRKGYENIRLVDKTAQFHNPAALFARTKKALGIPAPAAPPVRAKAASLAVR
jgi:hypothetical protein